MIRDKFPPHWLVKQHSLSITRGTAKSKHHMQDASWAEADALGIDGHEKNGQNKTLPLHTFVCMREIKHTIW